MQDKFISAANADTQLRKLREADRNAQKQQTIFTIAAGLVFLAFIYISNFAVQVK